MNFLNLDQNELLAFAYIMGDVVSVLIFLVILIKNTKKINKTKCEKIFGNIIICHIIFFLTEIIWAHLYFEIWEDAIYGFKAIRSLKYIVISIGTSLWAFYIEAFVESKLVATKKRTLLFAIPILINVFICIAICATIDPTGDNIKDSLFSLLITIIPFIYMLFATIHAGIVTLKNKNILNKKSRIFFALYPMGLIIAAVLQIIFQQIPILCFASSILMIAIYLTTIESKVSTDELTRLNNRNELNRYVYTSIKPSDNIYVVMMDIDKFKNINDKVGHIEGDRALVLISNALRVSFGDNVFIARYGGDEFIAFFKDYSEDMVINSINNLNSYIEALKDETKNYTISISYGYAKMKENEQITSLIDRADKKLYKMKNSKNTKRR